MGDKDDRSGAGGDWACRWGRIWWRLEKLDMDGGGQSIMVREWHAGASCVLYNGYSRGGIVYVGLGEAGAILAGWEMQW